MKYLTLLFATLCISVLFVYNLSIGGGPGQARTLQCQVGSGRRVTAVYQHVNEGQKPFNLQSKGVLCVVKFTGALAGST